MSEMNLESLAVLGGSGGLIAGFALYLIKLLMTKWSEGDLNIAKSEAEVSIIEELRTEVSRIKADFHQMKEDHKKELEYIKTTYSKEQNELETIIKSLKEQFDFLKRKNESMRSEALEAYAYITTREDLLNMTYTDELKERLMKIITDGTR